MPKNNQYCKDCGKIKDEPNKTRTYCAACKCIREKARYAQKRKLAGKQHRRLGRNPICKCGLRKENPHESLCKKCIAENKRLFKEFKKEYQIISNPNCTKCGSLKTGWHILCSSWCNKCVNEKTRERRAEKKALGLNWIGNNRKKTCNSCGLDKEANYLNDSLCATCRSIENKDKKILERARKGLPLWGAGRSPFCSACGEKKDDVSSTSGYCRKCKLERNRLKTSVRRESLGLGQWGSGERKKHCGRCGKEKENRRLGYCYACKAFTDSERRFQRVATLVGKMRERDHYELKKKDPVFRLKKAAHTMVTGAIYGGHLIKKPCEICGKEKADAHHDDYNNPLNIRWLCRLHHMQHHNEQRNKKTEIIII